jgi:hypothetical protein
MPLLRNIDNNLNDNSFNDNNLSDNMSYLLKDNKIIGDYISDYTLDHTSDHININYNTLYYLSIYISSILLILCVLAICISSIYLNYKEINSNKQYQLPLIINNIKPKKAKESPYVGPIAQLQAISPLSITSSNTQSQNRNVMFRFKTPSYQIQENKSNIVDDASETKITITTIVE